MHSHKEAEKTDLAQKSRLKSASLQYFPTQLGDSGILDELVRLGVEENDTIKIGEYEFDYVY